MNCPYIFRPTIREFNLIAEMDIELEDFCAYFKPLMENKPKIFDKVFTNLCEVGDISFKKILSTDKEKFKSLIEKYKIQAPLDDFIFRKIKLVRLKDKINPAKHNIETLKSSSLLVLLLLKDILFKVNKKSCLAKSLCR